jgi:hypothetical protein
MNLPFTIEQFLDVFAQYNNTIWPFQFILYFFAVGAIYSAIKPASFTRKTVLMVLGFLWLWMGVIYHIFFFSSINPAAYGFGTLFVIQGFLFIWLARKSNISFSVTGGWRDSIGGLFIAYGLVFYPLLGIYMGHVYPSSPTFGAPCPTTIFTFGILLWSKSIPLFLLIIPILWSLIGFTAAFTLGIYEDVGLLVSGITAVIILMKNRRTLRSIYSQTL